jgi:hypothetical protein
MCNIKTIIKDCYTQANLSYYDSGASMEGPDTTADSNRRLHYYLRKSDITPQQYLTYRREERAPKKHFKIETQDFYEQGTQSYSISPELSDYLDEDQPTCQCITCTHEMWHYCTHKEKPLNDITKQIVCTEYKSI